MFHLIQHLRSLKLGKLFLVSFSVYTVINFTENLIHYNIGRSKGKGKDKVEFEWPNKSDLMRILSVMILFGTLQGVLTCYFLTC